MLMLIMVAEDDKIYLADTFPNGIVLFPRDSRFGYL